MTAIHPNLFVDNRSSGVHGSESGHIETDDREDAGVPSPRHFFDDPCFYTLLEF